MIRPRTLTATLLCAAATVAAAGLAHAETPRSMMVELHVGVYTPDVDAQFETATPYNDAFGDSGLLTFKLHIDYQIWQGHGTLAIGGSAGYGWVDGEALTAEGDVSDDEVGFNMAPLNASVVYRWDWLAIRFGVPLVPYVKGGLSAAIWWATNGKGEIANTRDQDGRGRVGRGVTFGFHAGGGLQFLLDALSPSMATGFDEESGVNNSFIFAELLYTDLNDFGASDSINLTDAAFSFGLMFEF